MRIQSTERIAGKSSIYSLPFVQYALDVAPHMITFDAPDVHAFVGYFPLPPSLSLFLAPLTPFILSYVPLFLLSINTNIIRHIRFNTGTEQFGILEGRAQITNFLFGEESKNYEAKEQLEKIKFFEIFEQEAKLKLAMGISNSIR